MELWQAAHAAASPAYRREAPEIEGPSLVDARMRSFDACPHTIAELEHE